MNEISKKYDDAILSFVEKIRTDSNVIAVLVYGSVSHGTVWQKSDIDMTVVVRDQKLEKTSYGVYEDGILINAEICLRSDLKRSMEKNLTGLWGHSIDATTKIVYTSDNSLYEYLEENKTVGQADAEKAIFINANWLIATMEKIEKWLVVKKDIEYARYYVLKAAEIIANIEVCSHFVPPTRESILQAKEINPLLIEKFYHYPMSQKISENEIFNLLNEMEGFILIHLKAILNVVTDFFGDGEIKTGTHISNHFKMPLHIIHPILDFLCDKGYLFKVSQPMRLTSKGKSCIEEAAFLMPKN